MSNIQVLDCTLRDGGYCNDWKFGYKNINKIIQSLVYAGIDIIECGFLTQNLDYKENITKFNGLEQIKRILPDERENKMFVAMMNLGEYNPQNLPLCDGSSLDGIRVAFHKKDIDEAIEVCSIIAQKGYKVFVQPMVSLSYSDTEFIRLIEASNNINPYAFYIVDSFGVMKRKDLRRLFYMVEHNLDKSIKIGYHSHNNMQLAYSNAQSLVDIPTKRDIIIDSSVYGMGRGAGNLNTELFLEYLNDNLNDKYKLSPILSIIDEVLVSFYEENPWGYSLPNYLSAAYNVHPNYASYLDEKKTLTIESMNEIFSMIMDEKKSNYDKKYIETLYMDYMKKGEEYNSEINRFKEIIKNKEIYIIAPGKSSVEEREQILAHLEGKDAITIGINFDYSVLETDYIFVSNTRRYRELPSHAQKKCIFTSNISNAEGYMSVAYSDLLNDVEDVKDNATMMLIKMLINLGVTKISIVGLDGYSVDVTENYVCDITNIITKKETLNAKNKGMEKVLAEYKKSVELESVTKPRCIIF